MREISDVPPTKRLDMFEDSELLEELFRRGRMQVVVARHCVEPFAWERLSQDPGYLDHVRNVLARTTVFQLLKDGQFNFSIPDRVTLHGPAAEIKSDLLIVTRKPQTRR